jgi:hypothetical protein
VFAAKYRRKVFYREERGEVGEILRTLCERKKVNNCESGSVSGSRAYAGRDTAKGFSLQFYRIFKGKEAA